MMKKIVSLLMVFMLLFTFSACKGNKITSDYAASELSKSDVSSDLGDISSEEISSVESDSSQQSATSTVTKDESKTNPNSDTTSTVAKPNSDTTTTVTKPKTGTTSMLEGLNFGGKTFTFAYRTDIAPNADEKARLKAFGQKYNCTIKPVVIPFDTFMDAMAKKIVAGQPYDVVFLHGSHMPACIINDLVVPLDDYFTTADIADPANPSKGGISIKISDYFKGKNGKLYGVSDVVNCSIGYYNKQALADAGFGGKKDPYYLWTQGKWTWDAFETMAKAMGNPSKGIYLSPSIGDLVATTGKAYITRNGNASYTVNLGDSQIFSALSRFQKWAVTDKIIDASYDHCQGSYEDFANGKFAMLAETSDNHIGSIKELIATKKSPAWNGGDLSLLGLVPLPQQKEGTKYIQSTWPCAIGASKTAKDPRVAVAYAIYKSIPSTITHTDKYALSESEQQFFNDLYTKYDLVFDYYAFRNSTTTGFTELARMRKEIRLGADVKASLDKYQPILEGLRDGALKDWK